MYWPVIAMNDRLVLFSSLPQKIQAAINSRPRDGIIRYIGKDELLFSLWLWILKTSNLMTPEIKTELAAYVLSAAKEKQ